MEKTYFVVTGIVKNKDKMLILKKSDNDYNYPGCWSFCSGFVKEFESAEDTILREIKEETGLSATIIKKGKIIEVHDKENNKTWVIATFICSVNQTIVKLDHENTDYCWITKEEIKNYKFVPGIIDDLKAVDLL